MTTPNTPMTEQEREQMVTPYITQEQFDRVFPPSTLTEADCIAADLANLRYKQNDGPAKDNQDRAVKLDLQWSEAARLGGQLS